MQVELNKLLEQENEKANEVGSPARAAPREKVAYVLSRPPFFWYDTKFFFLISFFFFCP